MQKISRPRPGLLCQLAIAAASCVAFVPAASAVCVSNLGGGTGPYHNSNSWSCVPAVPGGVPGINDDAQIIANDTLILTASADVNSLLIDPTSSLTFDGFGLQLRTSMLDVLGTIDSTAGSTIYLTGLPGAPLTLLNSGSITAGTDAHLFIHDGGPGGDLPCPSGSQVVSFNGSFEGGANHGNVYILASTVLLDNATVLGGSGNPPVNIFNRTIAGNVYVAGVNVTIQNATQISPGDNMNTPTPGITDLDGTVKVVAQTCPGGPPGPTPALTITDSSLTIPNPVTVMSVIQCPNVTVFSAGTSTITNSTIHDGAVGCLYWDPPDLELAGDAELIGGDITIAGDTFDASGLASRTLSTPAIQAAGTLEIRVNQDGLLDLSGLSAGFPYFTAGQILIYADPDDIVTDRGVKLRKLMQPSPKILRPEPLLALSLNPDTAQLVSSPSTVSYPVQVTSVSSVPVDVEVFIEDSAGWLAGGSIFVGTNLDPGESVLRTLEIQVPAGLAPGEAAHLKIYAEIDGGPSVTGAAVFTVGQKER